MSNPCSYPPVPAFLPSFPNFGLILVSRSSLNVYCIRFVLWMNSNSGLTASALVRRNRIGGSLPLRRAWSRSLRTLHVGHMRMKWKTVSCPWWQAGQNGVSTTPILYRCALSGACPDLSWKSRLACLFGGLLMSWGKYLDGNLGSGRLGFSGITWDLRMESRSTVDAWSHVPAATILRCLGHFHFSKDVCGIFDMKLHNIKF